MTDRWVERWDVLSNSDPSKSYVVARDGEGEYGCSCPHWKFRRKECQHVRDVKAGRIAPRGEDGAGWVEPAIVLYHVLEVELDESLEHPVARTPLYPLGDDWFQATIVHDLLALGVRWSTLKGRYPICKRNSRKRIMSYVEARGRRIYGELSKHPGMTIYQTVPVERAGIERE